MSIQRKESVEKRAANRFVHGIMAADVFADNFQFAIDIEDPGGVNSTGARKIALMFSQKLGQRKQCFDVDPDFCRSDRGKILADGGNAVVSANSAAGCKRSESFRGTHFQLH